MNDFMTFERERGGRVMKPFVDWAFKYLFAREESKQLTIGFLNLLLKRDIADIKFLPTDRIPESEEMKRCVFDVLCEDKDGAVFLVEMQNAETQNFNNRILYYTCRLVDRMGKHDSEWKYDIRQVYTICLMNYIFDKDNPKLRNDIMLYNTSKGEVFSDRINIILLQIPCVKAKSIEECQEIYEKMLFLLQSMQNDNRSIEELKAEVESSNSLEEYTRQLFKQLLEVSDIASLPEDEKLNYYARLKIARDNAGCLEVARSNGFEEGREEGREEGKISIAKAMKEDGISAEMIAKYSGLSLETIAEL